MVGMDPTMNGVRMNKLSKPTVKLISEAGYIFDIGDLEFNDGLERALVALNDFLGPFRGEPFDNALEIYEIDGGWSARWSHVVTDELIYQDGSWSDQNDD
jgi:hypothetical protein